MKRHCVSELPEGYELREEIDLQKDRKKAILVNGTAVALMVLMLVPALLLVPVRNLTGGAFLVKMSVLIAGYVLYIIAHEATHGAVMKLFGAQKLRFGFTGLYAYAGSEQDYFDRTSYICISLAPLVVWGIVFTILCIAAPVSWFWVFYFLQIGNVSGAAGDLYVFLKTLRCPRGLLVRDSGVNMNMYWK